MILVDSDRTPPPSGFSFIQYSSLAAPVTSATRILRPTARRPHASPSIVVAPASSHGSLKYRTCPPTNRRLSVAFQRHNEPFLPPAPTGNVWPGEKTRRLSARWQVHYFILRFSRVRATSAATGGDFLSMPLLRHAFTLRPSEEGRAGGRVGGTAGRWPCVYTQTSPKTQ